MHAGNVVLVLHTHLPYVLNHGTWPHGSDWVCEAVAECYIPLLNIFHELISEGISPKITIDISPVLCEQLSADGFPSLFKKYCQNKMLLAKNDAKQFLQEKSDPHQVYLATLWEQWYFDRLTDYENKYSENIIEALKLLQDAGHIEIMTCGATHGYFPLIGHDEFIHLQVQTAVKNYEKHFGKSPRGIWLPECAYRPAYSWKPPFSNTDFAYKWRQGVEEIITQYGLEYFVADQHLAESTMFLGSYNDKNVFAPDTRSPHHTETGPMRLFHVRSLSGKSDKTAIMFSRHQKISMQVWSGESGYPGDPAYLDFHKKHWTSGLRYWRVTDNKADMMYKLLYVPDWIEKKTELHAFHFIKSIEQTALNYYRSTGRFGTLCLPFDAELFGHWWFEGPYFLRAVLRGLHHSPYVNSVSASEHIDAVKPRTVVSTIEGSWGRGGKHEVWGGHETSWTWGIIYADEKRILDIIRKYNDASQKSPAQKSVINQLIREMMLLHSSDWQFLISTGSAKDYAEMRFSYHHSDIIRLCEMAERYLGTKKRLSKADKEFLIEIEKKDSIFSEFNIDEFPALAK